MEAKEEGGMGKGVRNEGGKVLEIHVLPFYYIDRRDSEFAIIRTRTSL